jgi:hypothetical protein
MTLKDWAEAAQALTTAVALVVAGLWSYLLFVRKRQKYQRTKVEHHVRHRAIGGGKILLVVEVRVANNGDVLVVLERGETTVKQLVPVSSRISERIAAGELARPARHQATGWDLIAYEKDEPGKQGIEIEPGNVDQAVYNFIVDDDARTVQIHSYFDNLQKRQLQIDWRRLRLVRRSRMGWHRTTVYDIQPAARPAADLTDQQLIIVARRNDHDVSAQGTPA